MKRQRQRGDTLIEVLFAVSIFSLVAVGGLSIMNQGSAASQRALEITLVRQQMDGQAEALRFLNSSYISAYRAGTASYGATPAGEWAKVAAASTATSASTFGGATCPAVAPNGGFIIDPQAAKFTPANTGILAPASGFSQLTYTIISGAPVLTRAEGIWVEGVRGSNSESVQSKIGFIDFHIRACWISLGQTQPVTLGTIVRLYEPR